MPPRHPTIARALGIVREEIAGARQACESGGLQHLLLACSGGADSVALGGLLDLLRSGSDGFTLSVGHVHHGLRAEADREAEGVAALAAGWSGAFFARRLSLKPGANLAERARDARREALRDMAGEAGAQGVVLAHTATDQAETVLMHMVRGAGLEGMGGMSPTRWEGALAWLRPALGLTRGEMRALCGRIGLGFVDDPTNVDRTHPRVRFRESILPLLRAENPRVEWAITAGAEHMRDAAEALDTRVEELWPSVWDSVERGLRAERMVSLPRSLRTRLVRRLIARGGSPPGEIHHSVFDSVDRALRLSVARAPVPGLGPKTWSLGSGGLLRLARGILRFEAGSPRDGPVDPPSAP